MRIIIIYNLVWLVMRARNLFRVFFLMVCMLSSNAARADDLAQSIVHMLDYIGVDYKKIVEEKKIVNEAEYAEQIEFSGQMIQSVAKLPNFPEKNVVQSQVGALKELVDSKDSGDKVADVASEV
ncbi:hypothetical protein [Sulfurirhabdus autotrophica]|nr:hypothetical protein [Sulfurirhabdus autotrophica]